MTQLIAPPGERRALLATGPGVGLLVVLYVLCQLAFAARADALGRQHDLLDVRGWYTPAEARDLLGDLGPRGRSVYAASEVTLDLLFPAVYGGLFAALIVNLYPRPAGRRLALVPVCGALADWRENGLAA